MHLARKMIRLPLGDQYLVVKVMFLLGAIRLGLSVLPFRALRHLLAQAVQIPPKPGPGMLDDRDKIIWATGKLARIILKDKPCLTQALTVQLLFKRRGYPADLRIGVAKNDRNQLEAHAWVESEGKIVIGGTNSPAYFKPLPSLGEEGV